MQIMQKLAGIANHLQSRGSNSLCRKGELDGTEISRGCSVNTTAWPCKRCRSRPIGGRDFFSVPKRSPECRYAARAGGSERPTASRGRDARTACRRDASPRRRMVIIKWKIIISVVTASTHGPPPAKTVPQGRATVGADGRRSAPPRPSRAYYSRPSNRYEPATATAYTVTSAPPPPNRSP